VLNPYIINDNKNINYVDVGASGGIEMSLPPILWNKVNLYAFEPDPKSRKKLEKMPQLKKAYPYGLGSENKEYDFYLNINPYTSSLYPANDHLLKQFIKKYNKGRVLNKVLQVDCIKMDDILDITPHLVKIDTQGSELDILKGAKSTLMKHAPLVITETWTSEVYKNAPCSWDIQKYMKECGYSIFDMSVAAAWGHETEGKIQCYKSKNIGIDFLFVKDFERLKETTLEDDSWVALCALLETYGFRDYAWYIAKNIPFPSSEKVIITLEKNDMSDRSIFYKYIKKIIRILTKKKYIHKPQLHY
jgi:FkbM family methyltransferase